MGVAVVVVAKVVWEAELIGAESIVMLPAWELGKPLPELGILFTVESLTTLEAAEIEALFCCLPPETSGGRIGDELATSPLLDERRWRCATSRPSIAIVVCHSRARFNKMTSSVDANRKHGRCTKLMKLNGGIKSMYVDDGSKGPRRANDG